MTEKHPITGKSVVRPEKMVAFVRSINPDAQDLEEIAKCFIEVGELYGIRGDMALCQSIIETGWFKYEGSAVTPDQHNYCGLGVTSRGLKGHSFKTVRDGVRAQIQHLFAYATKLPLPENEEIIDPRFKYVTRGIAPNWEDLNMRWAMNNEYGQKIVEKYHQLLNFNYGPVETMPITTPTPITPEPIIKEPTNPEPTTPPLEKEKPPQKDSNIDRNLPSEKDDHSSFIEDFNRHWNRFLDNLGRMFKRRR